MLKNSLLLTGYSSFLNMKTVKWSAVLSYAAAEEYVRRLRVMMNKAQTRISLFVYWEEQVRAGYVTLQSSEPHDL